VEVERLEAEGEMRCARGRDGTGETNEAKAQRHRQRVVSVRAQIEAESRAAEGQKANLAMARWAEIANKQTKRSNKQIQ
jgi:hypothetical protein